MGARTVGWGRCGKRSANSNRSRAPRSVHPCLLCVESTSWLQHYLGGRPHRPGTVRVGCRAHLHYKYVLDIWRRCRRTDRCARDLNVKTGDFCNLIGWSRSYARDYDYEAIPPCRVACNSMERTQRPLNCHLTAGRTGRICSLRNSYQNWTRASVNGRLFRPWLQPCAHVPSEWYLLFLKKILTHSSNSITLTCSCKCWRSNHLVTGMFCLQ